MKTRLELKIDNPCAADWQKMQSTEKGHFCLSCQKNVIDFTALGEHEVESFFKNYKGKICGRFQPHQLKQYTYSHSPKPPFLSLLTLLGLTFSVPAAQAQNKVTPSSFTQPAPDSSTNAVEKDVFETSDSTAYYKIKGKVLFKDGTADVPMPGATIKIKDTELGAVADTAGNFELNLKDLPPEPFVAKILLIGFATIERTIEFDSSQTVDLGRLFLEEDQMLMGEVVVVGLNPVEGMWWRIKNLFR